MKQQTTQTNRKFNNLIINALMFFISVLALSNIMKSAKDNGTLNKELLKKETLYNILNNKHKVTLDSIEDLKTINDSLVAVKPKIKIKYEIIKKEVKSAPDSVQLVYLDKLLTIIEQYSNKKD